MNKLYLLLALTLSSVGFAHAQDATTEPEPVKNSPAKDRLLIGVSLDNWLNGPACIETKIYSPGFNAAAMYDKPFGKSTFSVAVGLGFSSFNAHSNARPSYILDTAGNVTETVMLDMPDSVEYKKNKLSLNFVEIPVEIRFRSRPDKSFRRFSLAAGFKFGVLVQGHTKYKDDGIKIKTYDIPNLQNLRYGPTFRIGYGKVSLFAFYSLTDVFKEGKGTKLTPVSAGIMVVPY